MTPTFPRARVTIATEVDFGADDKIAQITNALLAAADGFVEQPRVYRTDMPERACTALVLEGTVNIEDTL